MAYVSHGKLSRKSNALLEHVQESRRVGRASLQLANGAVFPLHFPRPVDPRRTANIVGAFRTTQTFLDAAQGRKKKVLHITLGKSDIPQTAHSRKTKTFFLTARRRLLLPHKPSSITCGLELFQLIQTVKNTRRNSVYAFSAIG